MITMTLTQAAEHLHATPSTSNQTFRGFSIDTRTLAPGNLFIAIKGEKVDGHDFLQTAKEKGASCALVQKKMPIDLPQIVVPDITLAMGKLASIWRNQFHAPLIAVTGSNGKTTLKNMLHAILLCAVNQRSEKVLATRGNLNNHFGLPLTLAELNAMHAYAVIEMGMNHFGEIDYLTQLAKPNIAVITNAAACHIEGVGDVAGVARAKAEIFYGLNENGIAILNRDDAFFDYWREQIGARRFITFGFHPEANVRATLINHNTFTLHSPIGDTTIQLRLIGEHNILNALAASAAAIAANIDIHAITSGLENLKPEKGRCEVHTLSKDFIVIDDTYNANPFSVKAAINTLMNFPKKRILILGDLGELGENAIAIHAEVGHDAKKTGIDALYTCGTLTAHTSKAFGEGATHFDSHDSLIKALSALHAPATILIKGSRFMKMEKVVAAFTSDVFDFNNNTLGV